MLLSTSSSKASIRAWIYTWLLVFIVCISGFSSYELYLKNKGFESSIKNNKNLWSWYRRGLDSQKDIVIVGASRSQIDIDINYLKNKFQNHHITQLSINGHYPMASLKALANDISFVGTVIVSLNAQVLEDRYLAMQKPYNDYYNDDSSFYKSLDAFFIANLESTFRFLHPSLGLEQLVDYFQKHKKIPEVFYTSSNLDQSITTDYSKTDRIALQKHFLEQKKKNYKNAPPTTVKIWRKNIDYLVDYTSKIHKRGGHVVLVRFPTDKGHWILDENYYPRKKYWDLIANNPGLTTLHFKDIVGVEVLDLPDSSHLDSKDAKIFTQLLLEKIELLIFITK